MEKNGLKNGKGRRRKIKRRETEPRKRNPLLGKKGSETPVTGEEPAGREIPQKKKLLLWRGEIHMSTSSGGKGWRRQREKE